MSVKNIIIAIAVVGIIGAGVGFYLYNKPQKGIEKIKAELVVDAKILYDDFDADESSANEKYLGKVIEVSGEIVKVENLPNGNISVALVDEMFGVTCTIDSAFAADNQEQISKQVKVGQAIAFKGKCDGMLTDVVLTQCIPIITK